jgi:hypothetical protein
LAVQDDAAPAVAPRKIRGRKAFAGGFEFFDFTVYATYLGMIGETFFPSSNDLVRS